MLVLDNANSRFKVCLPPVSLTAYIANHHQKLSVNLVSRELSKFHPTLLTLKVRQIGWLAGWLAGSVCVNLHLDCACHGEMKL